MPDIQQTPARIDNTTTTGSITMKTPLKPSPALITSPLKQANSLGSGSFHQQDEELDTIFGHNPFKSAFVFEQPSSSNSNSNKQEQDENSPYAARVEEWYSFASFDPLVDSFSTFTISGGSAAVAAAQSLHNSSKNTTKKRVQWKLDENGEVECQEYEPTFTDFDLIRSQWYEAQSFRQFRSACHEVSLKASLDPEYTGMFRYHLILCRRGVQPEFVDSDDVLEFASYRGLERAIFRQELQAAKYSAIQNTVAQQDDPFANSVDALGETSRQWTATARQMARALARADELIAQDAYNSEESSGTRRFIEI